MKFCSGDIVQRPDGREGMVVFPSAAAFVLVQTKDKSIQVWTSATLAVVRRWLFHDEVGGERP